MLFNKNYIFLLFNIYMKYKINYKKNITFVNKLDSNFKFQPIIKNNFFNNDTNKRFKDLYLDFDYYYHRDEYNNETKETVKNFMLQKDAVNSALNLISFWTINLAGDSLYKKSEVNNGAIYIDNNDNFKFNENILKIFSNIGNYGIMDSIKGTSNTNMFTSKGPLYSAKLSLKKSIYHYDSIENIKKYLEDSNIKDYLEKEESEIINYYSDNDNFEKDVFSFNYILRQACYIYKIRMLIFLNYPYILNEYYIKNKNENKKDYSKISQELNEDKNLIKKNLDSFIETVVYQNHIGDTVKQSSFIGKLNNKIIPILDTIQNSIENYSEKIR